MRPPYSPAAFWRARLGRFRTRRLLEAHLLVVVVCAAVAVSALLLSYRQTQQSARTLATREAPAVQGLAATRLAVLRADWEVDDLVRRGLVDVAGSGEAYRSQLSAADQVLSRIGDRTDQDLGTVNGLLDTYGNSLTNAMTVYHDQRFMREQKRLEAHSLLTRPHVGLVPRLDQLQHGQLTRATATASMGWLQRGGWWLAEATLAVLALALLSALFVLRDRCGRDWDPSLLAALALTVLCAVWPPLTASSAQDDLDAVRADLRQVTELSQRSAGSPGLAARQEDLAELSEQVRRELSDDGWVERVYQGSLIGGLLVVFLPVVGIGLRLDVYWRRR
ncbi:hypothetical protein [Streptomyces sp. NPDC006997]|uniref:hypothetical protein n=1 Tax=Streptomyces sp. NPDC006997 TaxID=3155356 RepID=UPI0033E0BB64